MVFEVVLVYLLACAGLEFLLGLTDGTPDTPDPDAPIGVEFLLEALTGPIILAFSLTYGVGWAVAHPVHKWLRRRALDKRVSNLRERGR